MDKELLKNIIEGALLAAGTPLTLQALMQLFVESEVPSQNDMLAAIEALREDYASRAMTLKEVASGYRLQVKEELAPWIIHLWDEKPQRYSRAVLETLVLIAYRQPITRGEIEDVRGVAVSSHIIKSLLERDWIRVVGTRDVPGRPSLYATTRQFLDYFNLKSLEDLPTLMELQDLESFESKLSEQLQLPLSDGAAAEEGLHDDDEAATSDEQDIIESTSQAGAETSESPLSEDDSELTKDMASEEPHDEQPESAYEREYDA